MTSFFSLRSEHQHFGIRLLEAFIILVLGWFAFIIYRFTSELRGQQVDYFTSSFAGILTNEFIPLVEPVLITLVPAIFVSLMVTFQKTSWGKLAVSAVCIGIILITPTYTHHLHKWWSMLQIVQGLPLLEVKYHRHTGNFPKTWIQFVIPENSLQDIMVTIEGRITQRGNTDFVVYKKAHDGREFSPRSQNFSLHEGKIEGMIRTSP